MSIDPKSDYYDAGGIETIDIIRAKLTMPQFTGFLAGNILKYSCRLMTKKDTLRDLEKIQVYARLLHKHIEENSL